MYAAGLRQIERQPRGVREIKLTDASRASAHEKVLAYRTKGALDCGSKKAAQAVEMAPEHPGSGVLTTFLKTWRSERLRDGGHPAVSPRARRRLEQLKFRPPAPITTVTCELRTERADFRLPVTAWGAAGYTVLEL